MTSIMDLDDCYSCGDTDECPLNECPKSQRPCGHHCNHSWTSDCCHWCGIQWGEDGVETWPEEESNPVTEIPLTEPETDTETTDAGVSDVLMPIPLNKPNILPVIVKNDYDDTVKLNDYIVNGRQVGSKVWS